MASVSRCICILAVGLLAAVGGFRSIRRSEDAKDNFTAELVPDVFGMGYPEMKPEGANATEANATLAKEAYGTMSDDVVRPFWPEDQNMLRSDFVALPSHKIVDYDQPSGYALVGLKVSWTGTCHNYCDRDGPAVQKMGTVARRLEEGDTGILNSQVISGSVRGTKEVLCPGKRFVSGLIVNTGGTCQNKCDSDGPTMRKFQLICSAPAEHVSKAEESTTEKLVLGVPGWKTVKKQCPPGTFVSKLAVKTAGTCETVCDEDGNMAKEIILTCSPPSGSCFRPGARGYWKAVAYTNGAQGFSYTQGTTHTAGKSVQDGWKASVSASMTASVEIGGEWLGGKVGASSTLTGALATDQSSTFSASASQSTSVTRSVTFGAPGGMVWQWEYEVKDSCGASTTQTDSLVVTKGTFEPPCCPPGFALEQAAQFGKCHRHDDVCICPEANCQEFAA